MNQIKFNVLILLSVFIFTIDVSATDYYFSKDRKIQGYYYADIYVLSLETGAVRLILPAENEILYPFVLSDQSKIFFRGNWKICVYDTKNETVDTLSNLGYIERIDNVKLIPAINEVFLDIIDANASVDMELQNLDNTLISINKDSYAFVDTISTFGIVNSLLSINAEKIFILQDSLTGIYFEGSNFKSGPFIYDIFAIKGYENLDLNLPPKFYDKSNGYALVRYVSNDSAHFVVCDPENKVGVTDLTIDWESCPYFDAYLSPDGDIVLDNVGNVYIYDGKTAKLKQRIKFTPRPAKDVGPLVLFLNNILYYLPEDPRKSDATSFDNIQSTDLHIVQSQSDLLSVMLDDLDSCCEKGWIENQGICNSLRKKLENAVKHFEKDQTKQAMNVLNAFKNELDAQKDKHVNNKAWTILSFNVEQIIGRKI